MFKYKCDSTMTIDVESAMTIDVESTAENQYRWILVGFESLVDVESSTFNQC